MLTIDQETQARRRGATWYPKRHDDLVIERWALACSAIHSDCHACNFHNQCQDLADRLIGCIDVRSPIRYQRKRVSSLNGTTHSQEKANDNLNSCRH